MTAEDGRRRPNMIPEWTREPLPTVEECQAAADAILERGYVMTTVFGEAPPVDEYRLSTR
ncbi:hypothetical protein [Streptomyces sp. NPDC005732]|uniref:hypothetical protein n=1 Tax=Streptomyces sp. NPDC005732 TaxID=3157057 RepID=UPI0034023A3E